MKKEIMLKILDDLRWDIISYIFRRDWYVEDGKNDKAIDMVDDFIEKVKKIL